MKKSEHRGYNGIDFSRDVDCNENKYIIAFFNEQSNDRMILEVT